MKVTLAYPIEDLGAPDQTVEVDERRGRSLIRDGLARPAKVRSPQKPRRASTADTKEADDGR